jgi:hypothetical protein
MDPAGRLMLDETCSADWSRFRIGISRIGNPLTIRRFKVAAALPIANRRYGRLTICATSLIRHVQRAFLDRRGFPKEPRGGRQSNAVGVVYL